MKRPLTSGRASEYWTVVSGSEKLHAHVHLGGISKAARPQFDVLKSLAIGAQRSVIVDASHHVRPVTGLHFPVSSLLEIKYVESFGGIGDHFRRLLCILGESAALEKSSNSTQRSDVGAGGKKLQEFAACYSWIVHEGRSFIASSTFVKVNGLLVPNFIRNVPLVLVN